MSYLEQLLEDVEVEWKPLSDVIISLKTGLNPRKAFKLNTKNAEGYYVTVRDIQDGKLVFDHKIDRVNKEALKIINNRSHLDKGDVMFSGTGTIGKTAVVEESPSNLSLIHI